MTLLLRPEREAQIERVCRLLNQCKAVALPTETVYGLAGLAQKEDSLAEIFSLKARPTLDPLIVHVENSQKVRSLVKTLSPMQEKFMELFWPGPLTILFEKNESIPDLCTANSPWVAIRSPKNPLFQKILANIQQPLAAPSANRFGRISPTCAQDVIDELGPFGLEAVLDGGRCEMGLESTVIKIDDKEKKIEIVRAGSLSAEDITKAAGPAYEIIFRKSGSGIMTDAPGQLEVHYAPRKPMYFFESLTQASLEDWLSKNNNSLSDISLLSIFPQAQIKAPHHTLSQSHSEKEAAANFFKTLRQLDNNSTKLIIAVGIGAQPTGLIKAIYDRLQRGSHKQP